MIVLFRLSRYRYLIVALFIIFVLLLCAAAVALVILLQSSAPEEMTVLPAVDSIQLDAPIEVSAGITIPIHIQIDPPMSGTQVDIIAVGTFGMNIQRLQTEEGKATGYLAPKQAKFAGTVTLQARAAERLAEHTLTITPGPPVDPIMPLVGPRSIVANGQDWTMLVATPRDYLDNPVGDNTVLNINVQHPHADEPRKLTSTVRHLMAWKRITSRTTEGKTYISVNSENAFGPEREILEVPGPPLPFSLISEQTTYPADGRRLVRINSEEIKDQYGNVLLDGTALLLLVRSEDKLDRTIPAYIVDGRIFATLQAPTTASTITIQAWVAGAKSKELQISFEQGLAARHIELDIVEHKESFEIMAGPILGTLDQFVPDGTEVLFTVTENTDELYQFVRFSELGYSTLSLRKSDIGTGEFTVLVTAGDGFGEGSIQQP